MVEVEGVEAGEHALGEVVQPASQLAGLREFVTARGERVPAPGEFAAAVFEAGGATLQLRQVDQPGLVEVGQSASLSLGGGELAVETCQLAVQQFSGADPLRAGLLAGQKDVGCRRTRFSPSQVRADVPGCLAATGPGPADSQPASGQGGLSRVGRSPIA